MPGHGFALAALQVKRLRTYHRILGEQQCAEGSGELGRRQDDTGRQLSLQHPRKPELHGVLPPQPLDTFPNGLAAAHNRALLLRQLCPTVLACRHRLPVTQRPEREEEGSQAARPYRTTTPWVKLAQKYHALAVEDQDGQEMHDASSGPGGSSGRSSPQDFRSLDEEEGGAASDEDDQEDEEEELEDARLAWEELIGARMWSSRVRHACCNAVPCTGFACSRSSCLAVPRTPEALEGETRSAGERPSPSTLRKVL